MVFDIDGTILDGASYQDGYINAKPIPDAIELLGWLRDDGWFIVLYTGRSEPYRNITEEQLVRFEVPYDLLVMGKPPAVAYVDDQAVSAEIGIRLMRLSLQEEHSRL